MSVRKDCFTVTVLDKITWKVSKSKQKKLRLQTINQ